MKKLNVEFTAYGENENATESAQYEIKKSNMMDSILEKHTMQLKQAKFADD